jgi:hypothetical protein
MPGGECEGIALGDVFDLKFGDWEFCAERESDVICILILGRYLGLFRVRSRNMM